MERLPDEIILRILLDAQCSIQQLLDLQCVCRRFYRIIQDAAIWYHAFMAQYPIWGRNVSLSTATRPIVDWKNFVLHISKQNKQAQSFSLNFVPNETGSTQTRAARQRKVSRKRKLTDRDSTVLTQDGQREWESDQDIGTRPASPTNTPKNRPRPPLSIDALEPSSSIPFSYSIDPSPIEEDRHSRLLHAPAASTSSTPSTTQTNMAHQPRDRFSLPVDLEQVRLALQHANEPNPRLCCLPDLLTDPTDGPFTQGNDLHCPPPYRIQDPLVVDVDCVTKTGIVATGMHRKEPPTGHHHLHHQQRSEHKILFWEYPSWRLVREFDLSFAPAYMSCQITGIQTIRMPAESGIEKVRLFSLAIGEPLPPHNREDTDSDDRVDIWKAVLIYRLFDDGATQCIAHLNLDGQLLGREVFFFSERSWAQSNDGDCSDIDEHADKVKDWISILAPEHASYEPKYTVFMLAIGPVTPTICGSCQLISCDIRGAPDIIDPAIEPVIWDTNLGQFRSTFGHCAGSARASLDRTYGPPARIIAKVQVGRKSSCMIHFRYPPQLNHLICTGSYVKDELTVYDWRFGIKLGVLPWKTRRDTYTISVPEESGPSELTEDTMEQDVPFDDHDLVMQDGEPDMLVEGADMGDFDDTEFDDIDEDPSIVRPWGLESAMVLPPFGHNATHHPTIDDLDKHGFRLIAVGDNRSDKLEIKVWDISYLLKVRWTPLADRDEVDETLDDFGDWSRHFIWWKRGTPCMKRFALRMIYEDRHRAFRGSPILHPRIYNRLGNEFKSLTLPYSPPNDTQSMILVHSFDSGADGASEMPVKYTAYNVLRTSLFLLTEEGSITVMDIESGQVIGTIDNVAASKGSGSHQRVRGIDVNVIGGSEIVVTSRQGLLRGTML